MRHTKLKRRLSLSLDVAHGSVFGGICRSMEPYEQAVDFISLRSPLNKLIIFALSANGLS